MTDCNSVAATDMTSDLAEALLSTNGTGNGTLTDLGLGGGDGGCGDGLNLTCPEDLGCYSVLLGDSHQRPKINIKDDSGNLL